MKNNHKYKTYYRPDGKTVAIADGVYSSIPVVDLRRTLQSMAVWWMRYRLPYLVESVVHYFCHVGRNLRQIEWQGR